ncbi:hypothetical protein [Rhodopseudomonas palustris]|uniref:hypothetical protein n=1 Tax=Rhodopseudomonas palustris TaxID=1076 RepID=UPI0011C3BC7D|nr:hypothetical protein [Rhodopseudomonas palustris]
MAAASSSVDATAHAASCVAVLNKSRTAFPRQAGPMLQAHVGIVRDFASALWCVFRVSRFQTTAILRSLGAGFGIPVWRMFSTKRHHFAKTAAAAAINKSGADDAGKLLAGLDDGCGAVRRCGDDAAGRR